VGGEKILKKKKGILNKNKRIESKYHMFIVCIFILFNPVYMIISCFSSLFQLTILFHITITLYISHIEHVIDNDCPPILSQIRAKFSLPNGSFVVPADVHDYLFDRKLLEVHHYLPSLFSLCLYLYLSLSFL